MKIEEVDMDLIEPSEEQPRVDFDKESLGELMDSIRRNGIIQPIILVKEGRGYKIVAGERRWRAAMGLKMRNIPAIIRHISSEEKMEIALVENIQRESLNPVEEAMSLKLYIDKTGTTQEELSGILGKSRSYISNSIRLLKLPKVVLETMRSGEISSGHGRTLLSVEDEEVQKELCSRIIDEKMSVRELERLILGLKKEKKRKSKKDIYIYELERKLSTDIGKKVTIKNGKKRGKLEIEYYGNEELESIVDMLSGQLEKA